MFSLDTRVRGLVLPQHGIPDLVSSPRETSLSSEEWMGVGWEEMGGAGKRGGKGTGASMLKFDDLI